jgi:saccharopine dehydrogenase-like NADP-dependent oxidoreductase
LDGANGRVTRILIIGGYGAFGARAAERLAREPDLEIIVAGRSRARAEAAALGRTARASINHAELDTRHVTAEQLHALAPRVVLNASGPYQNEDYRLAKASIAAGCHYVDLADARAFVTGITALDAAAKARDVLVVSGASSVPGLSSAVVRAHAGEFNEITGLDIGISPGNRFDPGEATVASVLSGIGKPIAMRIAGLTRTVAGWQGASRHRFPAIGRRWMGYVDVPDLDLFPAHYPSLDTVRFKAGLEVPLFHLALWGLSWLVRGGLLPRPERLARPLLAMKRGLSFLGSDKGAMFVTLEGIGRDGRPLRLTWTLIANSGHGPFIPAIPAVILAKRLARGTERRRGSMPGFGLMALDEFVREVTDLDIASTTEFSTDGPVPTGWTTY